MTIEERNKNKVIGQFLNYPQKDEDMMNTVYCFHKDWNILTEVIKKIENLYPDKVIFEMSSCSSLKVCVIYTLLKDPRFIEVHSSENTLLKAICNACYKFIKQYNEKNNRKGSCSRA